MGGERTPPITPANLDGYLTSHLIDPTLLRADNFDAFMADRQARLLRLIEQAIGQAAYRGEMADEDAETEGETAEAVLTMVAAA